MFYEDQGNGLPVIFLHGFPLDHTMWQHQTAALKGSYRVITPDLPGMGQSDIPQEPMMLDEYANRIIALMDHLNIHKAVLAGFSMGGYVAFSLLSKAPERFTAVILSNTRPESDSQEARINRFRMAASLLENGSVTARDAMLPKLLTGHTLEKDSHRKEMLSKTMLAMKPEGLVLACLSMAYRKDSSELLAGMHMPALVIAGSQDIVTPPEIMEQMAKLIPNAHYAEINGAAHLAPLERPEDYNRILLDFLQKLGS